ncbi:8874_t:CDS:10 [Funneliformis caledonium]|uniref:8874_t:CDS:1 n=1 Tax=Funneliformis caledonium TaxID=1117310 RepID=A0A9N9HI66_9GLOM|nr:8874_t:CDS:10 [Funneliformis caledonium]
MKVKRELSSPRRSPRFNTSPKRRRSFLLPPPTRSILKKNDDTTNFDILQDENLATNVLDSLWETDMTENVDGQRRRKSIGRRVSFASKARVRLFDKYEVAGQQPADQSMTSSLNGDRDETSEFMLTINTQSPENIDLKPEEMKFMRVDQNKLQIDEVAEQQQAESIVSNPLYDNKNETSEIVSTISTPSPEINEYKTEEIKEIRTLTEEQSQQIDKDVVAEQQSGEPIVSNPLNNDRDEALEFIPIMSTLSTEDMDFQSEEMKALIEKQNQQIDKYETAKQQPAEPSISKSINDDRNEATEFMLTISTPSSETNECKSEEIKVSLTEEQNQRIDKYEVVEQQTVEPNVSNPSNDDQDETPENNDFESEEMKLMRALVEEQNQQIEIFEAEFENINKEMQTLGKKRDHLIKEKVDIEQKIRDAKRLVEVTQCYTEKDLHDVQEQYRALVSKHKWTPKTLSDELVHLEYDETIQVKIDIRDLRKRGDTNIPFVEVLLNLNDNMKPEEKLYYQIIFDGVRGFALNCKGPIEITQCSKIIKSIADYWENSRQLYRDYHVLKFKLPTEIISGKIHNDKDNNGKEIIMRFRDIVRYPNVSNMLWEIEPIYGKVNESFIKESINEHFSSNVIGCIRNACVIIQKQVF